MTVMRNVWLPMVLLLGCATPNQIDAIDASSSDDGSSQISHYDRPIEAALSIEAAPSMDGANDSSRLDAAEDTAALPPDALPGDSPPSPRDASVDRTDTANACNGLRCGFECIDPNTNPLHCGACMIACAGSCTAGKCACEIPSPANLVRNGGFDTTIADWRSVSQLALSRGTQDASLCSASGSLTLTYAQPQADYAPDIWQCIDLPNDEVQFNAGAWASVEPSSPRGYVDFWVMWYPEPGCREQEGVRTPYERRALPESEHSGEWRRLHLDGISPPPGTRSVRIRFGIYAMETSTKPFVARADMFYLTPTPGGWK